METISDEQAFAIAYSDLYLYYYSNKNFPPLLMQMENLKRFVWKNLATARLLIEENWLTVRENIWIVKGKK